MNSSDRQKRIGEFLRPQSVHHGQLETYLIAVPPTESAAISDDRKSLIRESLGQQQSNLIPLIVRRTDAYAEEEYEVVYGAEWCLVAKELNIERLWVWVFDLTDQQAEFLKSDMEQLLGLSNPVQPEISAAGSSDSTKRIEDLIRRSEATLERKLQEQVATALQQFEARLANQFLSANSRLSSEITLALEKVLEQPMPKPTEQTQPTSRSDQNIHYKYVTLPGLKEIAKKSGIKVTSKLKKEELVEALEQAGVSLCWH